MADAPRPPLADMDWTAGVEAVEAVLADLSIETAEEAAVAVVQAVWPILHAAATPRDEEGHRG